MNVIFCILRRDEWKTEAAVAKNGKLCRYLTTDENALSIETGVRPEIIQEEDDFRNALMEELKGQVVYTFDGRELIKFIKKHKEQGSVRIADLKPMISSIKKRDVSTAKYALDLLEFSYDENMFRENLLLADLRAVSILHGNLNSKGQIPEIKTKGNREYPLNLLRLIFGTGLILCILMLILNHS
jgi:hypothetical protein